MFKKILQHKLIAGIILLVIIAGGYFGYTKIFSTDGVVRYATAQVQKGTLIVSISGSGQVSASHQVDIKPKVAGEVAYVGVKDGQEVKAGALLYELDTRDAKKAVRDAEISLENARLALEKLKRRVSDNSSLGASEQTENQLRKARLEGLDASSQVYTDLSPILDSFETIMLGDTLVTDPQVNNVKYYVSVVDYYAPDLVSLPDQLETSYRRVRKLYNQYFADYAAITQEAEGASVERTISETYNLTKQTANIVKSAFDLVKLFKDKSIEDHWQPDKPELVEDHLTKLTQYLATVNSHLSAMLNAQSTIEELHQAAGEEGLDIKSQELTVQQRENALLDAKEKLSDYFIRAPFNGVVAKAEAEKGDQVSGATILATLITRQKLAEISLNEVDAVKAKVGQKATLTFDAVPDLTITGKVAEVDAVGTVSQGVVTYTAKIAFDTQDERVKPAMSASAEIVTEAKPNVLLVPNSAVRSQGNTQYVEIVEGENLNMALAANVSGAVLKNSPRQQMVEVGLSNDESTEVKSGLEEGDIIVTRTIQPNSQQPQVQQQSGGLRIPGLPGGGGGGR